MKKAGYIFILGLFLLACNQNKTNNNSEIVVFCAASLTDVISEITTEFEKENGVTVKLNLASSGTLARQIEHGATPSIYFSADKKWMNYLIKNHLIENETVKKIAGNSMVLIVPNKSTLNQMPFSSNINLPEYFDGRLSIGDPNHVPAGSYATQLLENLGWSEELEPRFLPANDVRSALMVVELGEVDAGIVYKTDALKSDKVKIITEYPDSLYDYVHYYMAIIRGQKNENSLSLHHYMVSKEAESIWKKFGFTQ